MRRSRASARISWIIWAAYLGLFCVALGSASLAQGPPEKSAGAVLAALEKHYHAARTLQATFLQSYSQGRRDVRIESGTVYFSQPGRMRWEYDEPEKKLFLADGRHVWFYVPADRSVTRAKVKESADWRTPLALLAGKGSLARACKLIEFARTSDWPAGRSPVRPINPANTLIRCLPKDRIEDFTEAAIEVDSQTRIARIWIRQPGSVETEIRFAAWRENIPLAETLFHFQAPPGVAIIEERLPGPSGNDSWVKP